MQILAQRCPVLGSKKDNLMSECCSQYDSERFIPMTRLHLLLRLVVCELSVLANRIVAMQINEGDWA
jgi:hypothetical protein